jgi:hypothetical protein
VNFVDAAMSAGHRPAHPFTAWANWGLCWAGVKIFVFARGRHAGEKAF